MRTKFQNEQDRALYEAEISSMKIYLFEEFNVHVQITIPGGENPYRVI